MDTDPIDGGGDQPVGTSPARSSQVIANTTSQRDDGAVVLSRYFFIYMNET